MGFVLRVGHLHIVFSGKSYQLYHEANHAVIFVKENLTSSFFVDDSGRHVAQEIERVGW